MTSVSSINKDLHIINYLIIRNLWDDIAYFNRNNIPKKVKGHQNWFTYYYSNEYHNELIGDLRSSWFKNICMKWNIDYKHAFCKFIINKKRASGKISNGDIDIK